MDFTMTGVIPDAAEIDPTRRRLTWTDGALSGDPYAVARLRALASLLNGTRIGPPEGPNTMRDHLSSVYSALILVAEVFARGYSISSVSGIPDRGSAPGRY